MSSDPHKEKMTCDGKGQTWHTGCHPPTVFPGGIHPHQCPGCSACSPEKEKREDEGKEKMKLEKYQRRNLIEEAKSLPRDVIKSLKSTDDSVLELAIAWMRGEVTSNQVAVVMDWPNGKRAREKLGTLLREAYRRKML